MERHISFKISLTITLIKAGFAPTFFWGKIVNKLTY